MSQGVKWGYQTQSSHFDLLALCLGCSFLVLDLSWGVNNVLPFEAVLTSVLRRCLWTSAMTPGPPECSILSTFVPYPDLISLVSDSLTLPPIFFSLTFVYLSLGYLFNVFLWPGSIFFPRSFSALILLILVYNPSFHNLLVLKFRCNKRRESMKTQKGLSSVLQTWILNLFSSPYRNLVESMNWQYVPAVWRACDEVGPWRRPPGNNLFRWNCIVLNGRNLPFCIAPLPTFLALLAG